ncbi:mannose-6-phosphate isomerase, class I [Gryllotalpicola protaetiae]|uniref:mannose-6-phosphate isomerase n=1 Tax=Gryllotalpicola protaetiae TaxID=2419771 RepID=A0A387BT99_9MICO|nr:mannose-6-phosphate isomerase, class I [Gryllotalpicola protaetiae]AYG04290.1 mannose-6-phosphate isomerase, class I [Gryllotalpicola protaetiae]
MFVRIDNTPRDYAWGSLTAIARLLGRAPSGDPEAELWLGAHAGSPARIEGGSPAPDLAAWIAADPQSALGPELVAADQAAGVAPHLPYLLKVLAAGAPLSLQAHPSPAQAAEGFARENAAGVPVDAAHRNYKDPFHKPEMLFALSDAFHALCGFRSRAAVASDLVRLIGAARGADAPAARLAEFGDRLSAAPDDGAALRDAVTWLLTGGGEVAELVAETVRAARLVLAECGSDDFESVDALDPALLPFETVITLSDAYPGEAGIVISLLLNRVRLVRGQALYMPAGNIHMYLAGLGIELMAASDNVLRGGFTPKHIDVPELARVLDFTPLPAPLLDAVELAPGVEVFRPDVPDFALVHATVGTETDAVRLRPGAPAIALATEGTLELAGQAGGLSLARGQAVYITPDEQELTVRGAGELFLATTGVAFGA